MFMFKHFDKQLKLISELIVLQKINEQQINFIWQIFKQKIDT